LRSGAPTTMPCVAVTDASRPEAAYAASRLGGLAHLPTSIAPTLLLVGHTFEAVLSRGIEPESLEHLSRSASSIALDVD
jgi:hypothetical protein